MKPTTMTQDYYDRYRPVLEGIENGYAPLLQRLQAEFGLNFLIENMGGGNEAIRAVMEGGWEIRITDGEDFIQSTLDGRRRIEASDGPLGWTVGIYRITSEDMESGDCPTVAEQSFDAYTDDLVVVVDTAIRRLMAGDYEDG